MKNNIHKLNGFIYITSEEEVGNCETHISGYKLILTNDKSLLTIQQLTPEEEAYCMTVDSVEVEKEFQQTTDNLRDGFYYKLQLPKQDNSFCETPEVKCDMNYCDTNGCQNRKRSLVEPKQKQETLEEFAERLCPNKQVEYDCILEGAKWQAERGYSEEDIALAFNEGQAYSVTGKLVDGEEWVKTHKKEWFNQNKKK